MHFYPTDQEIEAAASLLVSKYEISSHLLGELFGRENRDHANQILASLGEVKIDKFQLAKLLIAKKGVCLFSGADEETRKLRRSLLETLDEARLVNLFKNYGPKDSSINNPGHMITPLVEKRWFGGGNWPREFVSKLGFPLIFAGVKEESLKITTIMDVPPRMTLPDLAEFQMGLKDKMRKVLERDEDKTRCVVTLPTGGGKTRVAVEAFIEWLEPRFAQEQYLIWIAQSEELCEQAIQCIKDLWSNNEYLYPLRIYRFFGDYEPDLEDLIGGVVVCSIQKLHNQIKKGGTILDNILLETGAMVIDEAHRAVSFMYNNLFDHIEKIRNDDLFPICGLTATPGRAGLNRQEETKKLVDRFEWYLIKPDLGPEYTENPLKYFVEHQFLARAKHITYRSGIEYVLKEHEVYDDPTTDERLSPGFLKRLAVDEQRNLLIIKRLLKIPKNKPTLVYACTVEHAHFLAVILSQKGRTAGVISSETPLTIRRGFIKAFKKGEINFLLNFGVLTTGFDAPNTEYVVICRPTTSVILYEQIIGRGLRGPKFHGTKECTIIDFADNIKRLGGPLAYERFSDDWTWDEEREEGVGQSVFKEIAATND
ncbi:MAG TPA: DEAD/DEAH box helicase family protein [Bacillota bacterium]|nr:DEAD/DEAH box helicase family protein [Bacillota bacterium]